MQQNELRAGRASRGGGIKQRGGGRHAPGPVRERPRPPPPPGRERERGGHPTLGSAGVGGEAGEPPPPSDGALPSPSRAGRGGEGSEPAPLPLCQGEQRALNEASRARISPPPPRAPCTQTHSPRAPHTQKAHTRQARSLAGTRGAAEPSPAPRRPPRPQPRQPAGQPADACAALRSLGLHGSPRRGGPSGCVWSARGESGNSAAAFAPPPCCGRPGRCLAAAPRRRRRRRRA